ncbi:hypothetical protein K402DRAFT_219599 [Aulographum hederae CBS 113979]|uniref:Uncharacterized protein n=1 Tax=Aulographum hederae CBS 113979 TaxID=1176131 RepID=A0A6G1GLH4_9PEZI|nr:hypothetical protein K402DRAFT_219599 [Aulographum hederae CBS 113979]
MSTRMSCIQAWANRYSATSRTTIALQRNSSQSTASSTSSVSPSTTSFSPGYSESPPVASVISCCRSQLPIHSTISSVVQIIEHLSNRQTLLQPENTLSASADSADMESIAIAIRLSLGYWSLWAWRHHQANDVQSMLIGLASIKAIKSSAADDTVGTESFA